MIQGMSDTPSVIYNEVDFILPVHRFHVTFSYVTKAGLPFVREFVLRLLHVSALTPTELAKYFSFSEREAKEAITDLLNKGDVQYDDDGNIELTSQSKRYFSSLGSTPQVATVKEIGTVLSFELSSFNCIGNKANDGTWHCGIKLDIDHEIIATSQMLASLNFQKQFYEILEKGYIQKLRKSDGPDRPRIYTMGTVKKLGQNALRLTTKFSLGIDGIPIERNDFDVLSDSEKAHELITASLSNSKKAGNLVEISHAMNTLNDTWTHDLFNENSLDVAALVRKRAVSTLKDDSVTPLIGQLYSQSNWDLIYTDLTEILPKIKKINTEKKLNMIWLAPSDNFWEASNRLPTIAKGFVDCVRIFKSEQLINRPVMYLPVNAAGDNKSISKWSRELRNVQGNIKGLLEGFLDGNVEIMIVENNYVAVCYHYRSELLPVTLPVGFVSKNLTIIHSIQNVVFEYITGMASFDNPNDIGLLDSRK
jgi:hypothetical protein